MNQTLKAWLTLGFYVCITALAIFLVVKSYKYVRGFVKRRSLLKRIKKICKAQGYDLSYTKSALLSVFKPSNRPEIRIAAGGKEYRIRFFAALKSRDTYTLTDIGSYYTTSNLKPSLMSHGHPVSCVPMNKEESRKLRLPFIYQAKDNYVKAIHESASTENEPQSEAVNILCINPVPVKLEIVKTNRPEPVFDGDMFKGHIIYSGHGLCKFLDSLQNVKI